MSALVTVQGGAVAADVEGPLNTALEPAAVPVKYFLLRKVVS